MQIDISELLEETGKSLQRQEELDYRDERLEEERATVTSAVSVDFTLTNIGDGLLELSGSYSTTLTLLCSRCLQETQLELAEKLLGLFIPENYDREIEEREGRYRVKYSGTSVDFWHLIRQDFLVNLPMRPLCKDNCRGLCPVCGENLNLEDCGHDPEPEVADPRLEALKDIDIESNQ